MCNHSKEHINRKELFEVEGLGNNILVRNNMSPELAKKLFERFAKQYVPRKKQIERLIKGLRKKIMKCNPLQLLSFCADNFLMSTGTVQSEYQLDGDDILNSRLTEYVQSVMVSSKSTYKPGHKDSSKYFAAIQRDFARLQLLIMKFYFSWTAVLNEQHPEYDEETQMILAEAQLLFANVRGQRYQVHEVEYLEKLLSGHEAIFVSSFGISTAQIIDGIKKLQFSLSQGKADALNRFGELFDVYSDSKGEATMEEFIEQHREEGQRFAGELFGTNLYDVLKVTGWPHDFVESMSLGINDFPDFFEMDEFGGWPIVDLPAQKKPFIKIGERFYCFDYYSLMDNFYRVVQKTIAKVNKDYNWGNVQNEASEQMVADVFSTLLPGCTVHRSNYYPTGHGNRAENDILITYLDTLFIIEVKAGSFVYTSPILDFPAHIKSYQALVEKADHQCHNIYKYLAGKPFPIIYNKDNSEKCSIDMSQVAEVFMISVTMDNINDFAARAEKLSFLKFRSHAMSISIDDLMVYRDYFDSPLVFLHFMKQRRQATQDPKLALNDELDHLGLYIAHNMYTLQLKEYPDDVRVVFDGYREELDKYFCALYHPSLKPEKPQQEIPTLFYQLISYLEKNNVPSRRMIVDYLLNFAIDARKEFDSQVFLALNRQRKTKRMLAINTAGNASDALRYTLFVNQPYIEALSDEYKRQYVLSTLLWNEEPDRVMIEVAFDESLAVTSFEFSECTADDIRIEERDILQQMAYDRAQIRVALSLQQGQLRDNDLCPCGSGKVYSNCCRDRFMHN